MGRLADAAGAKRGLTGPVAVTDGAGTTRTYPSEAEAEKALPAGAVIEHRRGAFFLGAAAEPEKPVAEKATTAKISKAPAK